MDKLSVAAADETAHMQKPECILFSAVQPRQQPQRVVPLDRAQFNRAQSALGQPPDAIDHVSARRKIAAEQGQRSSARLPLSLAASADRHQACSGVSVIGPPTSPNVTIDKDSNLGKPEAMKDEGVKK